MIPSKIAFYQQFSCLLLLFFGQKIYAQTDSIKYIRINIHYMLKADGSGNFNEYWDGAKDSSMNGYRRARLVTEKANFELAQTTRMFRNADTSQQAQTTNLQYLLCGVYFHRDEEMYQKDLFDGWEMAEKYNILPAEQINIYNIIDGQGSVTSNGIANQILSSNDKNPILICKLKDYATYLRFPEWSVAFSGANTNHEIGHLLGLSHTWDEDDACEDTPMAAIHEDRHRQCWGYNPKDAFCGNWGNLSNNIMDYNENFPHAYTRCQVEKIHQNLLSSAKKYVATVGSIPSTSFFLMDKICKKTSVLLQGEASFNEESHEVIVFNLGKKGTKKRRKATYTVAYEGKVSTANLSELFNFKSNRYYLIRLKVFSSDGETDQMEQIVKIE